MGHRLEEHDQCQTEGFSKSSGILGNTKCNYYMILVLYMVCHTSEPFVKQNREININVMLPKKI